MDEIQTYMYGLMQPLKTIFIMDYQTVPTMLCLYYIFLLLNYLLICTYVLNITFRTLSRYQDSMSLAMTLENVIRMTKCMIFELTITSLTNVRCTAFVLIPVALCGM